MYFGVHLHAVFHLSLIFQIQAGFVYYVKLGLFNHRFLNQTLVA